MAVSLEQLTKALVDAGLCAADEVPSLIAGCSSAGQPPTAETLARKLIGDKRLTAFQAQQALAGRGLAMGEYVIVDRIGAGGMGQVFKAQHRRMKRVVALKVMSPAAMKDAAAVKRFQREVEAAARLVHPNIVTAFDAGEHRATHFLVMEFVDGGDLSALVKKQGRLPVDKAIDYTLQAARGLAFAHAEHVIHRDIKPANLLVDKKGVVKILDMGLARFDDGGEGLTGTEQVMGTVDYMSPEQAAQTKGVDARADIYSLGCTLWYLLTASKLYDGETLISRMLKHREEPIPSLMQQRDDVPWGLEQLFRRMVGKRTEDRPQSMDEVVAELEKLRGQSSGVNLAGGAEAGDAALSNFLSGIGKSGGKSSSAPGASGPSLAAAASTRQTTTGDEATSALSRAEIGTDPKSELHLRAAPPAAGSKQTGSGKPAAGRAAPRGPVSVPLVVGGAAVSVVLVATGVWIALGGWVIVRDPQGNEIARVQVPEGGTVTVVTSPPAGTPSAPRPPAPRTGTGPTATAAAPPTSTSSGVTGTAPSRAVAPFNAAQARAHQEAWARHLGTEVETVNSVGQTMILIPPGEFLMGSTDEQVAEALKVADEIQTDQATKDRIQKSEGPQHKVVITKPFLLSATEVTVGQFKKFSATGYVTETEKGAQDDPKAKTYLSVESDDFPAGYITWNDAVAYCNWLSEQENRTYRLPTEAEWEYACRAGTTTQYSFGDDYNELPKYGWHNTNAGGKSHPVGTLLPNPFGLFDMHGNLLESCGDYFDEQWYVSSAPNDPDGPSVGSSRVKRGGYWSHNASYCRSASRVGSSPTYRASDHGFRCVLELPAPPTAGFALDVSAASARPQEAGVELPRNVRASDPLTVEMWVRPRSVAAASESRQLWSLAGVLELKQYADHWVWQRNNRLQTPRIEQVSVPMGPVNRLAHLAAVSTGKELRLYVDGQLAGTQTLVNPLPPTPGLVHALVSGGDAASYRPFDGTIDEVRISKVARYDKAFTPAPRLEPDVDTLALYHCDEGTGDVLGDASGHGHEGKLIGVRWVRADGSANLPSPLAGAGPGASGPAPAASTLDLLATFDPARSLVGAADQANWQRAGTELTFTGRGQAGLVKFPYPLADRYYRLEIEFTRTAGDGGFNIDLPLKAGMFTVNLDERGRTGLARTGQATRTERIETGRRYRVSVTMAREGTADRIALELDGRPILAWTGDRQQVVNAPWKEPASDDTQRAGLWIPPGESRFTFHRATVTWLDEVATSPPAPPATGAAATPTGSASAPRTPAGYALDLSGTGDGESQVFVDKLPVSTAGKLTAECWVVPRGAGEPQINYPLVNLGGHRFALKQYGRRWVFNCRRGSTKDYDNLSTTVDVVPGQAAHLAAVADGREMRLYVQGKLAGRMPLTVPFEVGDYPMVLGGAKAERPDWDLFDGLIDEVRISSTARYSGDFTPVARFEPDAHTLALYHCDEGTGNVLVDSSGHGRSGRIKGATWARFDSTAVSGAGSVSSATAPAGPTGTGGSR